MSIFDNNELFEGFEDTPDDDGSVSESSSAQDNAPNKYKEEMERLKEENRNLKRSLRILTRPNGLKVRDAATDGPIAHLLLFNNVIARQRQGEILEFFHHLSQRRQDNGDDTVTDPQPTFIQYAENNRQSFKQSSRRAQASTKAFQAFGSIQMYQKFFTDQLGEPLSFQDPELSEWFCPEYEKHGIDPLSGDPDNPVMRRKKVGRICFNCGESDHQLKECPKAKDYRAINQRRQQFNDDIARFSGGSPQIRLGGARYHADEDDNDKQSRFASFRPGVISSKLQDALGITERDIPHYIYRMRQLGYPPGHLANARVTNSGLSLYDEDSNRMQRRNENEYVPVDVNKLIGYPGFNIPPLPGQTDRSREFGAPPMDHRHSKEVMVSYFEHRNSLHKQKQNAEAAQQEAEKETRTEMDDVDMEMGDEECEATEDTVIVLDDDEVEDGEVDDDGIAIEVGDLTEDELEIKREQLLKELRQSGSTHDSDYRINQPPIIDLTEMSESDPDWSATTSVHLEDTDARRALDGIKMTTPRDSPCVDMKPQSSHDQRMSSGDTDYRLTVGTLPSLSYEVSDEKRNGTSTATSLPTPSESSDVESPVQDVVEMMEETLESDPVQSTEISSVNSNTTADSETDQKLPHREKFAEGITSFDAYHAESASSGMYKRLSTLLKNSPRRKDK